MTARSRSLLFVSVPVLALVCLACRDPLPAPGLDDEGAGSDSGEESESTESESTESESTESGSTESESTESSSTESESTESSSTESESTESSSTTGGAPCVPIVDSLWVDADTPLESLACVEEVLDKLVITGTAWTDFSALPLLSHVKSLSLTDNAALVSFAGADALTSVESLGLTNNASLASLEGLDGLETLENLRIWGAGAAPTSLAGTAPTTRMESITLYDWSQADVDLLGTLAYTTEDPEVGLELTISEPIGLTDLGGISACCAERPAALWIFGSQGLTSLEGLEGLTTMRELWVIDNDELESLAGLDNLEAIGRLRISGDYCDFQDGLPYPPPLTSLVGLGSLVEVENLDLLQLANLESLSALNPALHIGDALLYTLSEVDPAELDGLDISGALTTCGIGDGELCQEDPNVGICPQ